MEDFAIGLDHAGGHRGDDRDRHALLRARARPHGFPRRFHRGGRHNPVYPRRVAPPPRRIQLHPLHPAKATARRLRSTPRGSIAKGAALVKTGGSGKTIQCAICHGDALMGLGEVPRIAGLQPVYIARQLIGIQNGSSNGTAVALMKKPVANLSEDDIISISAYLGLLPPR